MKELKPSMESKTIAEWSECKINWKRKHPIQSFLKGNIYYPVYHLLVYKLNPKMWYREIKWFIQRGKRGWADCDVWSIDCYLNGVIPAMLKRLKKTKMGIPIPDWCKSIGDREMTARELTRARREWDKTLQAMIDAFEASQQVLDFKKKDKDVKHIRNKGFYLFYKHYFNLWD